MDIPPLECCRDCLKRHDVLRSTSFCPDYEESLKVSARESSSCLVALRSRRSEDAATLKSEQS